MVQTTIAVFVQSRCHVFMSRARCDVEVGQTLPSSFCELVGFLAWWCRIFLMTHGHGHLVLWTHQSVLIAVGGGLPLRFPLLRRCRCLLLPCGGLPGTSSSTLLVAVVARTVRQTSEESWEHWGTVPISDCICMYLLCSGGSVCTWSSLLLPADVWD